MSAKIKTSVTLDKEDLDYIHKRPINLSKLIRLSINELKQKELVDPTKNHTNPILETTSKGGS